MSESFREASAEAPSFHPFPFPSSSPKPPFFSSGAFPPQRPPLWGLYAQDHLHLECRLVLLTSTLGVPRGPLTMKTGEAPHTCSLTLGYFQVHQHRTKPGGKKRLYSGGTDGVLKAEMDGDILETHPKKQSRIWRE